jgi:hypothetical protein
LDTSKVSDEAKHMLKTQTHEAITKLLQQAAPYIHGFSRLKNGNIGIHAEDNCSKRRLDEINWEQAIRGLKPHQCIHGMVLHGVPNSDIDFTKDQRDLINEIEDILGCSTRDIERVSPLRRKPGWYCLVERMGGREKVNPPPWNSFSYQFQ